mgnify:CR=1 FL=1
MNLKVTNGLSTIEVWLDDNVLKSVSSSLDRLQWLLDVLPVFLLGVVFLVLSFDFLDEVFDLLLGDSQVVVFTLTVLVLEGELLDKDSVWIC